MDSIYQVKIGIVIISVGLLTLIYPLTYNFLANVLRELFEIKKFVIEKKLNVNKEIKIINTSENMIKGYYSRIGFVLNLFFFSGLLFVLTFILSQFKHEGHNIFEPNWILWIFPFLIIPFYFYLKKRELVERGEKKFSYVIIAIYIIILVIVLLLSGWYNTTQNYCLLLFFGVSILYFLIIWFVLGLYFRPTHQLEIFRMIVLDIFAVHSHNLPKKKEENVKNTPNRS